MTTLVADLQEELGWLRAALKKASEAEQYQIGHNAEARRLQRAKVIELTDAIARKRAEIAALTTPRRVLRLL